MDCSYHPGTAAAAICTRCDQFLCTGCVHERTGRKFCAKCVEFFDQRNAQRTRQAGGVPAKQASAALPASAPPTSAPPASTPAPAPDMYQGPPPPTSQGLPAAGGVAQAPAGDVYQGQAPTPPTSGMYQGPPPPSSQGLPAASGVAQAPAGDVYQGQAPAGDVYQGEAPAGDVYQGEAPAGDIFQGQAHQGNAQPASSSDAAVTVSLAEGAEEKGSTGRAIIFGMLMAVLSAGVWYAAVIFTGYQFGFLAIFIGWLVGVATTAGAGRGGAEIAILSLVIAAVSMIAGDYLINDHMYHKFTTIEIQAEEAFTDGEISDDDIAMFYEISLDELYAETSDQELEGIRRDILAEVESDYDPDEPEQPYHLPLSMLPFWMGWWEYVFIAIGAAQAFRVPMGAEGAGAARPAARRPRRCRR